jgi:hypothetical protein
MPAAFARLNGTYVYNMRGLSYLEDSDYLTSELVSESSFSSDGENKN